MGYPCSDLMEKIKDATFCVMMNKELRHEFLDVYDEFPSLYDKYKKRLKNKYPKRLFDSCNIDYYKIAGVFCEAEKNKELMNRIGNIFLTYLRLKAIDNSIRLGIIIRKNGELHDAIDYDKKMNILSHFFDSETYYEFHFLYVYFYERSDIFNDLDEEDPMRSVITSLSMRSFKQISNDYNRYIRTESAKTKFSDEWSEILKNAKLFFETPRDNEFAWGTFINTDKGFDSIERRYQKEMFEKSEGYNILQLNSSDILEANIVDKLNVLSECYNKARGFSIKLAFTYEFVLGVIRFIRNGIDVPTILLKNPLKDKEIRDVVYTVKHGREIRKEKEPSSPSEWLSCVHEVCILCLEETLTKNYISSIEASFKEDKTETDATKKSLEKTLLNLKEENERLNKIVSEKEKTLNQTIKTQKSDIKELHAQIYDLKKRLEEYEKDEIQIETIPEIENVPVYVAVDDEYDEAQFVEFIKKYKVLIWGVRDKTERKYKELYPELYFANTDRDLTFQQVSAYDAVIINTSFTSHSKYFCARDVIKSAKKPFSVLSGGANNQSQLWKAGKELEKKLQNNHATR